MQTSIFFIILVVTSTIIQDLYNLLTKNLKNYITSKLTETYKEDISFIDQSFFNATKNLLLSLGFKEIAKYQFGIEDEKDGYLEHFVNLEKGMLAIISQTAITQTDSDEDSRYRFYTTLNRLTFSIESYFDDQTHIITSSSHDYLDTRKNVFRFSYPFMAPEQILHEHEKKLLHFSEGRTIDKNILKDSLIAMNERESKELIEHLIDTGILKYNAKKDGYYLTLSGYFKYRLSQIKLFIATKKKHKEYKVTPEYKVINYCQTTEEKTLKQEATSSPWIPIILGIILCICGIHTAYQASKSNDWPKTTGEIISFTIEDNFDSVDAEIIYKYVIDGKTYISDKTSFGDASTKNDAEVQRLYEKYNEPGTIVDVYYDPRNPSHAVLEKGNNFFSFWPLIMGVIILFFCIPSTNKH